MARVSVIRREGLPLTRHSKLTVSLDLSAYLHLSHSSRFSAHTTNLTDDSDTQISIQTLRYPCGVNCHSTTEVRINTDESCKGNREILGGH